MSQRGFAFLTLLPYLAGLVMIGALIWWADSNIVTSAGVKKGKAEIQAKWDAANKAQREAEAKKAQEAATKTEAARVEIRYRTKTITQEVDKIVDRPVYSSVCLDADGLRLARCAIRGQSADTCKPDKPMPGAVLSLRWDWSLRTALDN